jgi:putative transcriptional regulator
MPRVLATGPRLAYLNRAKGGKVLTSLTGQLLIAMPQMEDPRFSRSVVFMCAHNAEGAMGLVVNKTVDQLSMGELLAQLGIEGDGFNRARVHFGGPVEAGRGFVLHSTDYAEQATLVVGDVGVTATLDILRAIGRGEGPRQRFFALGYAGWGPGQLDAEIQANGWLTVPSDNALLFDDGNDDKWRRAIAKLGVDPFALSGDAGHA